MIKCGLCGKEFEDDQFDEYAVHVKTCAYTHKIKADTERMKKINKELDEVKKAGQEYERLKKEFKTKYPDIYKANFKDENHDACLAQSATKFIPNATVSLDKLDKEELDKMAEEFTDALFEALFHPNYSKLKA